MAGQEESSAQLGLMQAMLERLDSIAEQVRITNVRVDALQVQGTAAAQSTTGAAADLLNSNERTEDTAANGRSVKEGGDINTPLNMTQSQ